MASKTRVDGKVKNVTEILSNTQQIQNIFRRSDARRARFERKMVVSHRSFADSTFKTRYSEYYDHLKAERYKTPNL